jgi:hypothetical protein
VNYDLAKELNDNGFPRGGKGTWITPPDKIVARAADRVYFRYKAKAKLSPIQGSEEMCRSALLLTPSRVFFFCST